MSNNDIFKNSGKNVLCWITWYEKQYYCAQTFATAAHLKQYYNKQIFVLICDEIFHISNKLFRYAYRFFNFPMNIICMDFFH